MGAPCVHVAGFIAGRHIPAPQWDAEMLEHIRRVNDFNTRGLVSQIEHPGFAEESAYCIDCGADMKLVPRMSFSEAHQAYDAAMIETSFADVRAGDWFRSERSGAWRLKRSATTASRVHGSMMGNDEVTADARVFVAAP